MSTTRQTRSHRRTKVYLPEYLPASVEQADSEPRLPFPLRSSDKRCTRQDIIRASDIAPLNKLPHSLIPKAGGTWMPPMIYYGWPLVDSHKAEFAAYGEAQGLFQPDEFSYPHSADSDEEEDPLFRGYVDLCTLERIAKSMAREAGWPDRLVRVGLPLHYGVPRVVAAYTNYDLAECPSDEDVKRLQLHMKFDDAPRWYVSMGHWNWSSDPQRRRL